jgi:hypothetical protein
MSDNVNVLIEKMNQESIRKKKAQENIEGNTQNTQAGAHDGGAAVSIDNKGGYLADKKAGTTVI